MKKILTVIAFAGIFLSACSQQTQESANQVATSAAEDIKANTAIVAAEAEAAAQDASKAVSAAAEATSEAAKNIGTSVTEATDNKGSAESRAPEDQKY